MTDIKRKILVVISSARTLSLKSPSDCTEIPVGFFLVELAKMLQEFESTHEFVFATPDGRAPQLDINGFDLNFHVQGWTAPFVNCMACLRNTRLGVTGLDRIKGALFSMERPEVARRRRRVEFDRRSSEIETAVQHLGKLEITSPLPNTHPETVDYRPIIEERFAKAGIKKYRSLAEIIRQSRGQDPKEQISAYDFVYVPGGHAPMSDLAYCPELGEIFNLFHEAKRLMAAICHGPVSLCSAKFRVPIDAAPVRTENFAIRGAKVTTVSSFEEKIMLKVGYVHQPSAQQSTQLEYFVDQALIEAAFEVSYGSPMIAGVQLSPGFPKVIYDRRFGVLTGNGPQSMDKMVAQLRAIFPKT